MFDALPKSIRDGFRDIRSDENPRDRIDLWIRQLRHNGWKLPDAIKWARHYPHGFGILGWHSVEVFGETWANLEKADAERTRAKHESGHLRILTVDDLLKQSPRDYLVKGWLSPNEISLLVGAKNTRKTFTALHVGYGIAQGWETVFGCRVKQAPVLYVITEGQGGFGKRVQALVQRYSRCDAFFVIAQPIDLLRSTADEGDLHDLIALAQANGVRLIVVDTLSKALNGGDENGPTDMGTLLGNLNTLRHATGAHVMGIHHGSQKDDTKSRGHSILPNGAEAIAQLEWAGGADGIGTLVLGFARDDICRTLGAFRTSPIVLGVDDDGENVTTLLVDECEVDANAKRSYRQLSDRQAHMLQVLRNVIVDCGQKVRPEPKMPLVTAVPRDLLRHAMIDAGWFPDNHLSEAPCDDDAFRPAESTTGGVKARKAGGDTVLARGAYTLEHNALRGLATKGFLAFNRKFVWLL
jgi:hypothetical protein